MSRSQRRRRRGYQPLPDRGSNAWVARLLVVAVGVILILGSLALFTGTQ
ncbi:MAG: hypothetical protein H0U86_14515 [Chloroflexi bacterium]|nr:hypothetical protein [Chloroflexota bacterium]